MPDVRVRALHSVTCCLTMTAWLFAGTPAPVLAEPPALQGVAESSTSAPAEYERLAKLGFAEFEAGNYAEARSRFTDAYQVYPNARVLRALGKCEYELQNYVAAVYAFEGALASDTRPLTPEQRTETEATLRDVRRYVVRYDIVARPNTAELLVDDQPAVRQPDGKVWLAIGDHTVAANLSGYRATTRRLHVVGGPDQRLELLLLPETAQAEAQPLYKKWWVWTSVGVVAAGAAVTAAVLATRDPGTRGFHKSTTGWLGTVPSSQGAGQ